MTSAVTSYMTKESVWRAYHGGGAWCMLCGAVVSYSVFGLLIGNVPYFAIEISRMISPPPVGLAFCLHLLWIAYLKRNVPVRPEVPFFCVGMFILSILSDELTWVGHVAGVAIMCASALELAWNVPRMRRVMVASVCIDAVRMCLKVGSMWFIEMPHVWTEEQKGSLSAAFGEVMARAGYNDTQRLQRHHTRHVMTAVIDTGTRAANIMYGIGEPPQPGTLWAFECAAVLQWIMLGIMAGGVCWYGLDYSRATDVDQVMKKTRVETE